MSWVYIQQIREMEPLLSNSAVRSSSELDGELYDRAVEFSNSAVDGLLNELSFDPNVDIIRVRDSLKTLSLTAQKLAAHDAALILIGCNQIEGVLRSRNMDRRSVAG